MAEQKAIPSPYAWFTMRGGGPYDGQTYRLYKAPQAPTGESGWDHLPCPPFGRYTANEGAMVAPRSKGNTMTYSES